MNVQVIMPEDRICTQPSEGFCTNPQCAEGGKEFHFQIHHAHVCCPKCGANEDPFVGILVLTHALIPDPNGPIKGGFGKFSIACNSRRAYLATTTNLEAVTDNAAMANCKGCLEVVAKLKINQPIGVLL